MILDAMENYMQLRAGTEPPPISHRWSFLTCLSAFMARKVWLPFGEGNIHANMYVMLIGDPGARKTTAINQAVRLFSQAGYETLAARKSSKEKFLMDLEGQKDEFDAKEKRGPGRPKKFVEIDLDSIELEELDTEKIEDKNPRHVLIAADEFNNFMGSGNLEFLSILGELWDWDNPERPYDYRLKNSQSVRIWQPTVSILGGNTPENFRLCFPEEALGQGYMSRQILVQCDRTDIRIPFPVPADEALRQRILADLREIGNMSGPLTFSPQAKDACATLYRTWTDLDDVRFRSYSSRRYTHLLKLCLLVTVNRKRMRIEEHDVLHANTILAHTEMLMPKAMGELGRAKNSQASQKLMQFMYDKKVPVGAQQLWKVVHSDLDKISDLAPLLDGLKQANKIQIVEGEDGKIMYLPKIESVKRHVLFVDLNYLRGKELPVGNSTKESK